MTTIISAVCLHCRESLIVRSGSVLLRTAKWGHRRRRLRFHRVRPVVITDEYLPPNVLYRRSES